GEAGKLRHGHLNLTRRAISKSVSTGNRNGIDACHTTCPFRAQSNVMLINKFPVGSSISVASPVDGLITGDVTDDAGCTAAVVGGAVVNCHGLHLVIRR